VPPLLPSAFVPAGGGVCVCICVFVYVPTDYVVVAVGAFLDMLHGAHGVRAMACLAILNPVPKMITDVRVQYATQTTREADASSSFVEPTPALRGADAGVAVRAACTSGRVNTSTRRRPRAGACRVSHSMRRLNTAPIRRRRHHGFGMASRDALRTPKHRGAGCVLRFVS
jgi:hypothetical protein